MSGLPVHLDPFVNAMNAMNVTPGPMPELTPTGLRGLPFDEALREATPVDPGREAAEQLVAAALVEPLLAELRETSRAAGPFAPGTAERRFGPLLDQWIAERVVSGANFPLVDGIRERLEAATARRRDPVTKEGLFE